MNKAIGIILLVAMLALSGCVEEIKEEFRDNPKAFANANGCEKYIKADSHQHYCIKPDALGIKTAIPFVCGYDDTGCYWEAI